MKRTNAVLGGTALLFGWILAVLLASVVFLQAAISTSGGPNYRAIWQDDNIRIVQGDYFEGPGLREAEFPAVGSKGELGKDDWVAQQFESFVGAEDRDYRRPYSMMAYSDGNSGTWQFRPRQGIRYLGPDGRLLGSLTEAGWVEGREAAFGPSRVHWLNVEPAHRTARYLSDAGLYGVDLGERKITRLVEERVDWSDLRIWRQAGRTWCLTGQRLLWAATGPKPAGGSLPLPAGLDPATVEARPLLDFGIILRGEIPGSRTDRKVEYRVAVIDGRGVLQSEYSYTLSAPPGTRLLSQKEVRTLLVRSELSGLTGGWGQIASSALMPPGLVLLVRSLTFHSMDLERLPALLRIFQSLVIGFIVSALLALWVLRSCLKRRRGAGVTAAWVLITVLFGVAGALTYRSLARFEKLETCGGCAKPFPASMGACASCGRAAEPPAKLGIEMLRPA